MDRICVLLGGRVSEMQFFGEFTSGAQDDLVKVTRLAYMQVRSLGFSDAVGWLSYDPDQKVSDATAGLIDAEARKLVDVAMKRTHEIVSKVRQASVAYLYRSSTTMRLMQWQSFCLRGRYW